MTALPISTIKDALFDYCVAATGLGPDNVVFAYTEGPEPQGSYVSIIPIMTVQRRGIFDEQITEDNADLTIVHRRVVSAQIDAYGPEAPTLIAAIFDALDVPSMYQTYFTDNNLSAMFTSNTRDLSGVKNIRYEQRYNVDLVIHAFYGTTVLADDIGWFDSFRLTDSILNTEDSIITGD